MMYTIEFICEILNIKPLKSNNTNQYISELVYDSRKVNQPDQSLFFALENLRDGHDFVMDAYDKGIRNFVISKDVHFLKDKLDINLIVVSNVLATIQRLASYHRNQFKNPVIGITGSNGKSIVKAWLSQLISPEKKVYQSPKSYNSQLGVALSLWNLNPQYDIALIEAGISEPGEMIRLQRMIQPTIGVLTNIGIAHAQNFKSKQDKLEEKLILFNQSEIIIAGSDYIQNTDSVPCPNILKWGKSDHDQIQIISFEKLNQFTKIHLRLGDINSWCIVPFTDKASLENVITCISVMYYLGYEIQVILERVQNLRALEMRLQLKKGINHCSIIDDSYSNDLGSLKISLDFLQQQNQHSKKTLVLSDMEGLRADEKIQNKLVDLLNSQSLFRLIWVGEPYNWLKNIRIPKIITFSSTHELTSNFTELGFESESVLVKGARVYQFEKVVQLLTLKSHGTTLEINMNALSNNLMIYRSLIPSGVKIMAMVKAFSYGSGSYEVANLLQFNKVDYLTVAFADEGVELRSAGITLPIMVLCPDNDTFESLVQYNLEPEVYSMRFLEDFIGFLTQKNLKDYKIHLKLDTGMHRLGFFDHEIDLLITRLKNQQEVKIQSFFTHLVASGDVQKDDFTKYQISTFKKCAYKLEKSLGYNFIKHVANTSAIARHPEAHFDMVRLGIGLYGVDMDKNLANLELVSTLKTTVTQIKNLSKNETIGYDQAGILTRDSRIATVKIGYADGYNRRFGNSIGKMKINNQLVPTIGNICMDMCMLDVTEIDVEEGDQVIVFPDIMEASKQIGTIPYELLVNISSRVKRIYYFE